MIASGDVGREVLAEPLLLGPYAARSCPVRTQHAHDPRSRPVERPADPEHANRLDASRVFATGVLDSWAALPGVVDLRGRGGGADETVAALRAGAPVVLGATLPSDPAHHRRGGVDALVRGADAVDGGPGYRAVIVKHHRLLERGRPTTDPPTRAPLGASTLARPDRRTALPAWGLRVPARLPDLLQVAHAHRLLEAAGRAAGGPARGAVIGTDDFPSAPLLVWVDLEAPLVRTFSRSHPVGWRLRSVLERYDHEHAFRVDVARRAQRQAEAEPPDLLVRPIRSRECRHCPWWEVCRSALDPDDVSLRVDKGALDAREIVTLRRLGVTTVAELAATDLDSLTADYLPEVTHRAGAEGRLRVAARRARMLAAGRRLERETVGPIDVPRARVEVDFDLESSASGRFYLWGFLVDDGVGAPRRHQFARFADLDADTEIELAREALGWLRGLVERHGDVRVHHYSAYEPAALTALAARSDDPDLGWAADFARHGFVDLLGIVQEHLFGADGLGLKTVAAEAGFRWRDPDPGGLNSQRWFADAVHHPDDATRGQARRRVLEYNEDDVRATSRLRAWLRAQ